jgi:hypothetical protein
MILHISPFTGSSGREVFSPMASSKVQEFRKSANGINKVTQIAPLSPESLNYDDIGCLPTPVQRNGSMRTDVGKSVKTLPLIIVEDRARVTAVAHPRSEPDPWQKKLSTMVDVPIFLCDEDSSLDLCFHESTASLSLNETIKDGDQEQKLAMSTSILTVDEATLRSLRKSKRRPSAEMFRKPKAPEGDLQDSTSHIPSLRTNRRLSCEIKLLSSSSDLTVDESSLRVLRKKSERATAKQHQAAESKAKNLMCDRSEPRQNISACEKKPGISVSNNRNKLRRAASLSSIRTDEMMPERIASEKSLNLNKERDDDDVKGSRRNSLVELGRTLSVSKIIQKEINNNESGNTTSCDDKTTKEGSKGKLTSLPRVFAEKMAKKDLDSTDRTHMRRCKLARATSLPRLIAERLMKKDIESEKPQPKDVGIVRRNFERAASLSKSVSERALVRSESKRKVDRSSAKSTPQLEKTTPTRSRSLRKLTKSLSDLKVGDLVKSAESKKKLSRTESSGSLKTSRSRRNLERQPLKLTASNDTKSIETDAMQETEGSSSPSLLETLELVVVSKTGKDSKEKENSNRPPSRGRTRSIKSKQRLLDDATTRIAKTKESVEQVTTLPRGARPPPSKSPTRPPTRAASGETGANNGHMRSTLRSQSPSGRAIDRSKLVAHPCSSPSLSPKKAAAVMMKPTYLQLHLPHSSSSSNQDLSSEVKHSVSCSALENRPTDYRLLSSKLSFLQLAEPKLINGDVVQLHASSNCSVAPSVSDATLKVSNLTGPNGFYKEESDSYSQSLSVESPFSGAIAV